MGCWCREIGFASPSSLVLGCIGVGFGQLMGFDVLVVWERFRSLEANLRMCTGNLRFHRGGLGTRPGCNLIVEQVPPLSTKTP